jgi:uncharacterized protein
MQVGNSSGAEKRRARTKLECTHRVSHADDWGTDLSKTAPDLGPRPGAGRSTSAARKQTFGTAPAHCRTSWVKAIGGCRKHRRCEQRRRVIVLKAAAVLIALAASCGASTVVNALPGAGFFAAPCSLALRDQECDREKPALLDCVGGLDQWAWPPRSRVLPGQNGCSRQQTLEFSTPVAYRLPRSSHHVPILPDVLRPQALHSRPARTAAAVPGTPTAVRSQLVPTKPMLLPEHQVTAGIVTGSAQSTDFALAYEIATTLGTVEGAGRHDQSALRVIPLIGNGGAQNIADVLTLPNADMTIAPVALLNRLRDTNELGDIRSKLVYIAPLFPEEFHILATAEIGGIRDLVGKAVNLGEKGSAGAMLGREAFSNLGIDIREVNIDFNAAIEAMRKGQVSATLLVSGKPITSLLRYTRADGFHFAEIPYELSLQQEYLPSTLRHDDYPDLIAADESIDTISVGSALMAYNWPPGSERFRPLERFVNILFSRLQELQTGSHHPKWRDVNVEAALPGWIRFRPAENWIQGR